MEDHTLERNIFDSTNAFQEREAANPGSELYRLKLEMGETPTLSDLVHNMCIGGVMDVMNDLRKKGYRSIGIWGTRKNNKNHEIGVALNLDGSIVAFDPTIAQTDERNKKRVVRIWKARNSADLEKQLVKEYGGNWKVKDAVDRANSLDIENPPIGFYLSGEEVNLDNYYMIEPLPESENWIVEIPTIPNAKNFKESLQKILPFALQDCHPLLKKCKGIIQFVDMLEHDTGLGEQMGHTSFFESPDGKESLTHIKVSLNSLQLSQLAWSNSPWEASAIGITLHEIYEIDQRLKTRELGKTIELRTPGEKDYEYAEHELEPNLRALKTIKHFFGSDFSFSGISAGLIVKIEERDKLNREMGEFQSDLESIPHRGRITREPVPYLHKDDHNFGNLMDTIQIKLKEQQKKTGSIRLGIVVGTGALLSIAPEIDIDAWLVLDYNAFVLEWSRQTITALRHSQTRSFYEQWVYQNPHAAETKAKGIDPNEWLEIEKQALGKFHFLNSDNRFLRAKHKLTSTPVLFSQGDLSNREYMEELAQILRSHNTEIAFANLTDILEFAPLIGDVIELLPFKEDAVIAHATRFGTTNNHPAARVSIGVEEYKQNAVAEKNLFYQQWNSRR